MAVTSTNYTEKSSQGFVFPHALGDYFKSIGLTSKGVSTFFQWLELAPFAENTLSYLAKQRKTLKEANSTFALPKFFINQYKLYEAWAESKLKSTSEKAKILFKAALGSLNSAIKIPLLLNKTHLIALSKISETLAENLSNTSSVLSFIKSGVKIVECSWGLGTFLSKTSTKLNSKKGAKLLFKTGVSAFKFGTATLGVAALVLSFSISSVALVLIATTSFATSLINKIMGGFFEGESRSRITYPLKLS